MDLKLSSKTWTVYYAFVIVGLFIISSVFYIGAVLITHGLGFRLEIKLTLFFYEVPL